MESPEDWTVESTLPLPNSPTRIPRLGFGVYLSSVDVCTASCLEALKLGYRHIDSAQYYANEASVGQAVVQSGIPRSDIFLTTKMLSPSGDVDGTYRSIIESVEKMSPDTDSSKQSYVDLFLIHSPHCGPAGRKIMWQALERAHEEGRCKAIGVSNFGKSHIEEMKSYAKVWPPMVNQIELHPFAQQRSTVAYCESLTPPIVVSAYSPLIRNQKASDKVLCEIAESHGKTPSQVLIRYSLQKGWVPLPKSDTPSRIRENAEVFGWSLSKDEMAKLDDLDEGRAGAIVEAVKD